MKYGSLTERGKWNRAARRSGGDKRFTLPIANVGMDFAVLTMQITTVRERLGQDGVDRFIKTLRERGDLECDDVTAQELAQP